MPWTLYRHILKELLKVMVPTTVVLVLVISFAAAIKPLADGLLEPRALVRFVLFLTPTMLQFALPFAAAFALDSCLDTHPDAQTLQGAIIGCLATPTVPKLSRLLAKSCGTIGRYRLGLIDAHSRDGKLFQVFQLVTK